MGLSAAHAYRADLGSSDGPLSDVDGAWISVAAILQQAATSTPAERSRLVMDATRISIDAMGAARVGQLSDREWRGLSCAVSTPVVLLADQMIGAGALELAACTLDALLEADSDLSQIDRGRVMARRARVDWKGGRVDDAAERYMYLATLGRRAKSRELVVRSLVGLVTVSQLRGNYPEMLALAKRAARMAESDGLSRLAREAHNGIVVASGVAGRVSDALEHGWRVYELSVGDEIDEAEILQNLGQVLLDAARFAEARSAFLALTSRALPLRIFLPAIGGLAVAAANSGRPEIAKWAATELSRIDRHRAPTYAAASAMLEVAMGLSRIGDHTAETHRRSAIELALEHGYHELVIRAESLETSTSPALTEPGESLTSAAKRVVRELESLEAAALPDQVAVALL